MKTGVTLVTSVTPSLSPELRQTILAARTIAELPPVIRLASSRSLPIFSLSFPPRRHGARETDQAKHPKGFFSPRDDARYRFPLFVYSLRSRSKHPSSHCRAPRAGIHSTLRRPTNCQLNLSQKCRRRTGSLSLSHLLHDNGPRSTIATIRTPRIDESVDAWPKTAIVAHSR